jgi:hypothetical protein
MASVSYGINHGKATANDPRSITSGTLAVSSNDIELRIDLTKSITVDEAVLALELFKGRLLTGGLGNVDLASN